MIPAAATPLGDATGVAEDGRIMMIGGGRPGAARERRGV